MKKINASWFLIAGLTLSLVFFSEAQASDLSPWQEAAAKYQSGSFQSSIDIYQSLLKKGKETAALDYDLGNAHFRLGHKGMALVYYERALRIAPRDEDIRWNIDVLKTAVTDRIESPEGSLIVYWVSRAVDRLTINEICMILSGLLLLWAALGALIYFFPMIKSLGKALRVLVLLILLPAVILFGFKWSDVKDPSAVILEKEAEARYGPSEKETKAFTLHEGAEAKVTDEAKDWWYLTLPDKNSGWVPKKSCEII